MTFKDVLTQTVAWLQQDKRVSYRALQRQFALDDAALGVAGGTSTWRLEKRPTLRHGSKAWRQPTPW